MKPPPRTLDSSRSVKSAASQSSSKSAHPELAAARPHCRCHRSRDREDTAGCGGPPGLVLASHPRPARDPAMQRLGSPGGAQASRVLPPPGAGERLRPVRTSEPLCPFPRPGGNPGPRRSSRRRVPGSIASCAGFRRTANFGGSWELGTIGPGSGPARDCVLFLSLSTSQKSIKEA